LLHAGNRLDAARAIMPQRSGTARGHYTFRQRCRVLEQSPALAEK
jgi:hypothetical protein